MRFSRWIFPVALGLTLTTSGQAQEQESESSRQTQTEANPASNTQFAIPIDIIEDKPEAEARQRSEEESREREIRSLAAQEGMNAATQSIEAATRDMRDYALYSTVAVWVGTFLLLYTLYLTRQANKAARDSVDLSRKVGVAQIRPWVVPAGCDYVISDQINIDDRGPQSGVGFQVKWMNTGTTPAVQSSIYSDIRIVRSDAKTPILEAKRTKGEATIGPNRTVFGNRLGIGEADARSLVEGTSQVVIFSRFDYSTVFDTGQTFHCEVTYRGEVNGTRKYDNGVEIPNIEFQVDGGANSAS